MAKQAPSNRQQTKSRILIVDDHPLLRRGLTEVINREPDLLVCGEAQEAGEALSMAATHRPHLAIVDLTLKDSSGLELIKDLKLRHPSVRVLVLSMHEECIYAQRVLRAGAHGYLMKNQGPDKVVQALRHILSGEVYLGDGVAQSILSKMTGGPATAPESQVETLSDRELEVFRLLGQGMGTRQIATKLHLSVKTIETYREHIKTKLNLNDASQLLQNAIRWAQSMYA